MQKPRHYLIFKILAVVFLVVAIVGIVLLVNGFGDFETNNFMIGGLMTSFGFFATFFCAMTGFRPEMTKMGTKSARYLQEQNKEDLAGLAMTNAQIQSEAVKTTARAAKEGFTDTKYCKHCGAKIDEDSRFCKECGGEQ